MQHIHISGFALFLGAIFILGLTAIVLGFISASRQARREAEIEMARINRGERNRYAGNAPGTFGGVSGSNAAASPSVAPGYVTPVYAAAPIVPGYGGSDLALGMMMGSAMNHHDTVIVDRGGGYVEPAYVAPSYDSGVSYDSGPSYSGGDSGGGIDISFGGSSD